MSTFSSTLLKVTSTTCNNPSSTPCPVGLSPASPSTSKPSAKSDINTFVKIPCVPARSLIASPPSLAPTIVTFVTLGAEKYPPSFEKSVLYPSHSKALS